MEIMVSKFITEAKKKILTGESDWYPEMRSLLNLLYKTVYKTYGSRKWESLQWWIY